LLNLKNEHTDQKIDELFGSKYLIQHYRYLFQNRISPFKTVVGSELLNDKELEDDITNKYGTGTANILKLPVELGLGSVDYKFFILEDQDTHTYARKQEDLHKNFGKPF
jgi:hypothetical protein